MSELTQDRLMELLDYDKETGNFKWKKTRSRFAVAGGIAGGPHPEGYSCIGIDGKKYLAHRLAWLFVHGGMPLGDIDHINGIRNDNRICNLRTATRAQNLWNSTKKKGALSEFKGVSKHFDRWHAQIFHNGERVSLKYFDNEIDAAKAYDEAAIKFHGEFAKTNFPRGDLNV